MPAYYNEHDAKAAAWLRALIAAGHIAPGDVDERSIEVVAADDLRGYSQCHFFAGIGVWSAALRGAGWPDDRPVWTGSCPCQPFSGAGSQEGFSDARHLWPHFARLIGERRPPVLFGEQVASPLGRAWLDAVCADMEGLGYAIGAADLCAAGVGAPHIRQRLYWVADDHEDGCGGLATTRLHERRSRSSGDQPAPRDANGPSGNDVVRRGDARRVEHDLGARLEGHAGHGDERDESGRLGANAPRSASAPGATLRLAEHDGARPQGYNAPSVASVGRVDGGLSLPGNGRDTGDPGATHGHWRDADWLFCTDGKWRPVEPGTFPLAHGAQARVGRLRGYGNAIVQPLAEAFIGAYLDTCEAVA